MKESYDRANYMEKVRRDYWFMVFYWFSFSTLKTIVNFLGKLSFPDKTRYEGEFRNGLYHGYGKNRNIILDYY